MTASFIVAHDIEPQNTQNDYFLAFCALIEKPVVGFLVALILSALAAQEPELQPFRRRLNLTFRRAGRVPSIAVVCLSVTNMPLIRISAEGEAKGAIIEVTLEANFEELDVTGASTQENITIHTNPVWLLWWQDVGAGVDPKALCNATLRLALRPPRRSRRFGGTASTSSAPAAPASLKTATASTKSPATPSSSHAEGALGDEPLPELEPALGTRPGAVAPPPSPPAPQTTATPAPAPQASAAPASKAYTPELIARMMNAEPKGPRNWNTIWMNGTVEQDRRDQTDAIKSSTDAFFDTGEVAASLPGFLMSIGIVDEDGLRNVTRSNEMREHIEKDTERLRAKSSRQNVPWFN
ncbi:hypothetical protein DL93DRAFT_2159724, partial [Clavulina sp. PMI_390]